MFIVTFYSISNNFEPNKSELSTPKIWQLSTLHHAALTQKSELQLIDLNRRWHYEPVGVTYGRSANIYVRPDSVDTRSRFLVDGQTYSTDEYRFARTGLASRFDLIIDKGPIGSDSRSIDEITDPDEQTNGSK